MTGDESWRFERFSGGEEPRARVPGRQTKVMSIYQFRAENDSYFKVACLSFHEPISSDVSCGMCWIVERSTCGRGTFTSCAASRKHLFRRRFRELNRSRILFA